MFIARVPRICIGDRGAIIMCTDGFSITSTRAQTSSRDFFMKNTQQKFNTSKSDDTNIYPGIYCR